MGLAKLLNRFSKGDKDKRGVNNNHGQGDCIGDKGKLCQCRILFLDDTDLCLDVKTGAKGHQVLARVYDYLNLLEKDYFGLRYLDETNQTHWLDPSKTVGSQLKTLPPHTLYFGVKFYAADPCKLREELTRYQFFLQVKRDILQGRLPIQFDLSVELAAFAVQSELGDYEAKRCSLGYVSEFRFVPNQSEQFEERVTNVHKTLIGMVPAAAEYRFLDKVKWLEMYGVDLHPVQGDENLEYFLGLTPTGIVVFRNKQKVGNFFWPRLNKVTFKGKMFMIRVKDKNKDENALAFECSTKPACKHLWKCCVEHHAFFRLTSSNESYSATGRFLIFGSKHRYSGRTEKQALADSANRPPPKVVRKPSKRHQRRRSAESLPNGYLQERAPENVIVMGPTTERVGRDRGYQSAPESPRSTRSAPWNDNRQSRAGLFTSGRSSPTSEYSDRIMFPRRQYESESEGGPKRRNHRSRMDASDSEAEYRARRPCRVPAEYTDASESESEYRKHRKYRKSMENVNPHEAVWNEQQRRIRDGGYQGPFQLRPNGRSKSPGNRKPPEELAEHFKYIDPSEAGIPTDQLRDIAYTAVDTVTDSSLKAKAHRRHRSKSPKNKHNENAEKLAMAAAGSSSNIVPVNPVPPVTSLDSEAPPPPYSESNTSQQNHVPKQHNHAPNQHNHAPNQHNRAPHSQGGGYQEAGLHPPIQPVYAAQRTYNQPQPQQPSQYGQHGHYRVTEPADFSSLKSPVSVQRNEPQTAPIVRTNYAKQAHTSSTSVSSYNQPPPYTVSGQSMFNTKQSSGKGYHDHVREDSGLGIESNPSSAQGSPASYTNSLPSSHSSYPNNHTSYYPNTQPAYPNSQPNYSHPQNPHSHYTEQVSSKSKSHGGGANPYKPNQQYQQHPQLTVSNQPTYQQPPGNYRTAYPTNGHYGAPTKHVPTASNRRIHNAPSTHLANDAFYGQPSHYAQNYNGGGGATNSEKTTDL